MQTRLEILNHFVRTAKEPASYSATMRTLRKKHPEDVQSFMKAFKTAFDAAVSDNLDNVEQIALMQAMKSV